MLEDMNIDRKGYRDYFDLDSSYIYFNSAGSSPMPILARNAVVDSYNFENFTKRHDSELFIWMDNIRSMAGRLINADRSEIALSSNTSLGLNMIAHGVDLGASDSVIVHRTEFPANFVPWLHLRKKGIDVRVIDSAGFPSPEDYYAKADSSTKIIAVSFVRFFDGFKFNLEELGEFCRERGILLVVDGIQGIGVLPFDVKESGIDVLACAGAKWLCSPCGCGFLYISKNAQEKIESPFAGWLSWHKEKNFDNCLSGLPEEPDNMRRFEIGTLPYPAFAGFEKVLEIFLEIGVENIYKHVTRLQDYLINFISDNRYFSILSSLKPEERSAFISIKSLKDNDKLMERFIKENVIVSKREGGYRVSPHLYNTMDEMERFCEILEDY